MDRADLRKPDTRTKGLVTQLVKFLVSQVLDVPLYVQNARTESNRDAIADDRVPVDDATADRQELDDVTRLIAALPATLKEPLVLRTIEGLSQAETADVLGITQKAVETRVYRARARLLENLSRQAR